MDEMDENVGSYRIAIRSKKWCWPILTWFIDISVLNAWHLRRSSGNDQPQIDFRRELVQCYHQGTDLVEQSLQRGPEVYPECLTIFATIEWTISLLQLQRRRRKDVLAKGAVQPCARCEKV